MSAQPKLTEAQWAEVRAIWEQDVRTGYSWLIDVLNLPVSAPAIRKVSLRDGWRKYSSEPFATQVRDDTAEQDDEPLSDNRRSKFKTCYIKQVYQLCLMGAIDAQLADFFEVSERTINYWKTRHPEFLDALKRGKTIADAKVAEALYQRAIGYSHPDVHISNYQGQITVTEITKHYPPDTTAAIFWLKNRAPDQWKEKVELKQEVNHSPFPSKEVLKEIFDASMKRSAEKAAKVANRRERLGIVFDVQSDDD